MSIIVNFLIGLLFGVGLVISGMSNPAKVLNFLDFAGTWDPSLVCVMAGAIAVAFIGYRLVLPGKQPLLAPAFQLPTRTAIDRPLLAGAAIFGVGWGLGGLCPGPAFTALGLGAPGVLTFVPAMLAGIWAAKIVRAPARRMREA